MVAKILILALLIPAMDTTLILENVCKHIELNDKEKKLFLSLLEPRTLKRKEIYLDAGELCRYSAFV
ncbi:MAG TPA: hypothetical protein VEW65_02890, partial [Chryseolinea sp.]|nr:hypothetical protein [Chryseolinea sp.]